MNSPFSLGRFEHDTRFRHAYYLPQEIYAKLGTGVPTYLIGGRGTGKTTLLKAFEWRERLNNPYLGEALGGAPFSDNLIGIYIKLSEGALKAFERWAASLEQDQSAAVFGLYFDLLWLEDFAIAAGELARTKKVGLSVKAERSFVGEVANGFFGRRLGVSTSDSLSSLSRRVQDMRFALYQAALVRRSFDQAAQDFPMMEPGEAGRGVATLFSEYATGPVFHSSPIAIRVLIDEADALTKSQHIVINTIIRLARAPLSYVFSSIKRFQDISSTTIPNLSVQRDDCQVVSLEASGTAQFEKLAEGVATVRLNKAGLSEFATLDLFRWFGPSSINAILAEQLGESLSNKARSLLDEARQVGRLPYFGVKEEEAREAEQKPATDDSELGDSDAEIDRIHPIYQVHLIRRLNLKVPAADAPYVLRRQKYAEVRKRMVAAYLDICRDLALRPRYVGARMILALADSSVRDFLLEMNELFIEAGGSIETLAQGRLSRRQQDLALHRASDQKISSLPQWVRLPHEKVLRFIDVFGRLTQKLQSGGESATHLLTSERGIFILPKAAHGDGFDEHRQIIEECVVTGYFSAVEDDSLAFRVHKILAPHYGFSYRGAYARVVLNAEHLALLLPRSGPELDPEEVAKQIMATIDHDDINQLKLSI